MANVNLTVKEDKFVQSMRNASGAVGVLSAKINIDLVRAFKEADKYQREFNKGIVRWGNDLQNTGQSLMYVSASILALGTASIKAFAELQAVQKGLEVVEGSANGAVEAFGRIKTLAKQPGLGMLEAAQGYTNLRAVGFGAEFAELALKRLGNALAISGKGKFEFGSILTQLTQMSSKSNVLAEDLKPILNSAPIIAKLLKDMYGSVDSESISNALKAQGKGPQDFIKELIERMATIPMVTGGAKNAIENFGDSMMVVGNNFGEVIDKSTGLTSSIDNLGQALVDASEWFKDLSPEMQNFIVISGSMALGIGPLIYGVGSLATMMPKLVTGLSATTAVAGGVVTAITALSAIVIMAHQDSKKWEEATKPLIKTINDAGLATRQQTSDLYKYASAIRTADQDSTRFKTAKNELIKINPQFNEMLNSNTISMSKFNDMVEQTNTNLMRQAAAKGLTAQLDNINTRLEDLRSGSVGMQGELDLFGQAMIRPGQERQQDRRKQLIFDKSKELFELRNDIVKRLNNDYNDIYNALSGNTDSPTPPIKDNGKIEKVVEKKKEKIKKAQVEIEDSLEDLLASIPKVEDDIANKLGASDLGLGNLFDNMPVLNMNMSAAEKERQQMLNLYESYTQDLKMFQENFGYILKDGLGDSLGNFFEGLASGQGIGGSFKGAMGGLIVTMGSLLQEFGKKALLAEKAIAAIKASFGTGPWAAIGAIALGGVIKGMGKSMSVPKFASGGMVTGQMLAMVGDNKSGKEAIIPFEKMGPFLKMANAANGGGNQPYIASFQMDARNFIINLRRVEKQLG